MCGACSSYFSYVFVYVIAFWDGRQVIFIEEVTARAIGDYCTLLRYSVFGMTLSKPYAKRLRPFVVLV